MSNSENQKANQVSYDIDDLVQAKILLAYDINNGVEKDGVYRVIRANRDSITVMTTKGTFVSLANIQVIRWGNQ